MNEELATRDERPSFVAGMCLNLPVPLVLPAVDSVPTADVHPRPYSGAK